LQRASCTIAAVEHYCTHVQCCAHHPHYRGVRLLLQKPSGVAWPSGNANRQIIRPSPSSSAKDVVDHGQRAHVAALDGAGLPALRALQPLPGPAPPQRPTARPGPQSHNCSSHAILSSTAGDSSIAFSDETSDGLELRRLTVAENVGRTHRSMRLRQPSQKAWPHVTSMRGTTPSLRRTRRSERERPGRRRVARFKNWTWTWCVLITPTSS
jgi:hypothetical protein